MARCPTCHRLVVSCTAVAHQRCRTLNRPLARACRQCGEPFGSDWPQAAWLRDHGAERVVLMARTAKSNVILPTGVEVMLGDVTNVADVKRVVDEATEACKAAPMPPLDILTTDVYADGGFAWRN